MLVPLCALVFAVWTDWVRIEHINTTTAFAQGPVEFDARSPTGYAGGIRELIIPEHNADSYGWIVQTQQMFARGEWRVRHIDYENAPYGREVTSASPYRWWLGAIAWVDQVTSGRPAGVSVERAARVADPVLHLLLLVVTTAFVAAQFGVFPAALVSVALVTLFPFAGGFVPGAPDDRSLSLVLAIWSVLPLLAGLRTRGAAGLTAAENSGPAERRAVRWFFFAGVVGGLGAWINVATAVPIVIGIACGGILAAFVVRREEKDAISRGPDPAWPAWALGGALAILCAYLIEYFPGHLGLWQMRAIHPLYGLAWLGIGAILVQARQWIQREGGIRRWKDAIVLALAVAAVAALPVIMWRTKSQGFLSADVSSFQLTKLSGGTVATSLWAWLLQEGIDRRVWAASLPLLLVLPAIWMVLRRSRQIQARVSIAVTLGPVLIAIGFAGWHLNWWSVLGGLLLVLLVATTDALRESLRPAPVRWLWSGAVAAVLALSASLLLPPSGAATKSSVDRAELMGLIERDLGHWLAQHQGPHGALVLAPPKETTPLYYYGGLPGLGTLSWENEDGIEAAIRILSAFTAEEAKELIDRRGVTHIVIPSWDSYLDEYARLGMGQVEGTFLHQLHLWQLPPWLRPVAYQMPAVAGFEGQSVIVLQVVENQTDAVAMSRLAEYFVDMRQLDLAASVAKALRRFPADLGALAARAAVEAATGDQAEFTATVKQLKPRLTGIMDRRLVWDRRVSLAVVLAQAKEMKLARKEVEQCLAGMDEAKLRSLSPGSLYRLQVLSRAFGLTITEPKLHALALGLLPADLRSRL